MEPNKVPKTMKNSAETERDSELNNLRATPREMQAGQGDRGVRIPTRPQNPRQITSQQSIYLDDRPGRSSERPPESRSVTSSSSQSTSHAKLNSNGSAIAGSSRSCFPLNNGLDSNIIPNLTNKLEGDKAGSSQASVNKDVRESRKRPSSLKLNRPNIDDDSSSLSDYSLGSEDGCIYTYRGGEHLADLPSSFFSLDMGLPADRLALPNYAAPQGAANAREGGSRASSPDMEFLEMDFDPGPSNEGDSGEESTSNADLDAVMDIPEEMPVRGHSPAVTAESGSNSVSVVVGASHSNAAVNRPSTSSGTNNLNLIRPSTSQEVPSSSCDKPTENVPRIVYGPYIMHVNAKGESILVRRTMCPNASGTYHNFSRETLPEKSSGNNSLPSTQNVKDKLSHIDFSTIKAPAQYQTSKTCSEPVPSTSSASLSVDSRSKVKGSSVEPQNIVCPEAGACVEPPRCMIWTEESARTRQVTQSSYSAGGATAVINVFYALGVPVDVERINTSVGTRTRVENTTMPSYILSRAVAGCTASDIIKGIQIASGGLVTARFFPTYPERVMSLSHFLADWISLGAVPILTLNLQHGCDSIYADAWHHQMVFGVSSQGVYICNPLSCVRENDVWRRLVSPSVLLVKAADIMSKFNDTTDLTPLMYVPDARFHTFNVLGQVVNVIRESHLPWDEDSNPRTQHIRIPAAYQAGITIAVLTGSEAHQRLMAANQCPLLDSRSSSQNDRF